MLEFKELSSSEKYELTELGERKLSFLLSKRDLSGMDATMGRMLMAINTGDPLPKEEIRVLLSKEMIDSVDELSLTSWGKIGERDLSFVTGVPSFYAELCPKEFHLLDSGIEKLEQLSDKGCLSKGESCLKSTLESVLEGKDRNDIARFCDPDKSLRMATMYGFVKFSGRQR